MGINTEILVKEKTTNGVLRLVMNDLKTRNALSENMMSALMTEIKEASIDSGIKVVVIASNGNVFCSGHDLKEINIARDDEDHGSDYFEELFKKCSILMQAIVNCPKPIIAEIDGVATAAGCQLVASCDLAIASNESRFATPGVNIGLFCSTPMVALSRNIPKKNAMKMLLTGDMISAKKAKKIGLINTNVDKSYLQEEVAQLASNIASKSTMTVSTGKKAFYVQAEMNLSEAYAYTSNVMKENLMRSDAKEGIAAFLEKRDPNWPENDIKDKDS